MTAGIDEDAGEEAAPRKRTTIFYAKDAAPLDSEMMATEAVDEALQARLARLVEAGVKPGLGDRNLVLFREPGQDGMSLVHIWFKSGYILPPHSHDCDCLYYVLGGELRIGARVLRKGDGLFVPAGRGYAYEAGPEGVEVLEFRKTARFNIVLKAGDEKRWDRIAAVFRERAASWETETVPPSDRPRTR